MTSKAKAIEAIEKAWEIINDKQPETTEEINLIRFAVNTARQLISKPTLDDAIAVVEDIKHDTAKSYSIVCETEVQKAIAKTVDNVLEDVLTALRGLKEGK